MSIKEVAHTIQHGIERYLNDPEDSKKNLLFCVAVAGPRRGNFRQHYVAGNVNGTYAKPAIMQYHKTEKLPNDRIATTFDQLMEPLGVILTGCLPDDMEAAVYFLGPKKDEEGLEVLYVYSTAPEINTEWILNQERKEEEGHAEKAGKQMVDTILRMFFERYPEMEPPFVLCVASKETEQPPMLCLAGTEKTKGIVAVKHFLEDPTYPSPALAAGIEALLYPIKEKLTAYSEGTLFFLAFLDSTLEWVVYGCGNVTKHGLRLLVDAAEKANEKGIIKTVTQVTTVPAASPSIEEADTSA